MKSTRIFLLANSWVGLQVARYLVRRGEEIVGLAIHEPDKQRNVEAIINTLQLPKSRIFLASELRTVNGLARLEKLKPQIGIAAFWGYILKPDFLQLFPGRCINFHPGYLPYTRGMNPNVWPFIEGTPAGVTIHYIDNGVDTGDVLARHLVEISPTDTAGTLYDKTLRAIVKLFKQIWPQVKRDTLPAMPQHELSSQFTFHRGKDVETLDPINLDEPTTARKLILQLRARSYADRFFYYYEENGQKVYIRLQLSTTNHR